MTLVPVMASYGVCKVSADGGAANGGLEQKEEAAESAPFSVSLWFWVGSCRQPFLAESVSEISKGPKDGVPEEGNVVFCGVSSGGACER